MRFRAPFLLALCALLCGYFAWRAGDRTYVAPDRSGPAPIPIALPAEVPTGFEARTLQVEGMCCTGCSAKLHGALTALDGVRDAAVDPLLGTAQALVPVDFDVARLEAALTFDKYSVLPAEASSTGPSLP